MNRIKFVGNAIFIPFFLLSVGMLMDIRILLSEPSAWFVAGLIVLLVIFGKFLAAWLAGKIYRYSKEEILLMFGLSIPQAAATLAATLVGFELGLFDPVMVNAVIVMILITCMIGPYTVEKNSQIIALREDQKPYEPSSAPERVMVPVANPHTIETLMGLSFMVRGDSKEPLFTLSVAQGGEDSAARLAEAEKLLGQATVYGASADVPIQMLTRVDTNVTSGMIRAMRESRITTAVLGWNGKLSTPQKIFGGILDQLLERTTQMILVAKLGHPLNVTKRLVIIIPSGFDHKGGYYEAIKVTKRLASQLGASIVCYVIKDEVDGYKDSFNTVQPDVQVTLTHLESWNDWHNTHMQLLRTDDVVLVFSARRGTMAWHPQLERLPRVLAHSGPKSFIIVYPPENEKVDTRGTRGTALPTTFLSKSSYK